MLKRLAIIGLMLFFVMPFAMGEETGITERNEIMIQVIVGEQAFTAELENNETAQAFLDLLPMTLDMSELNGNEKYHYLMSGLPSASKRVGRIEAGDLMLYGSDCVVLFYDSFSTPYSYTRIGHLTDPSGLREVLGRGSIQVTFTQDDK